jgi:hypothetical protein
MNIAGYLPAFGAIILASGWFNSDLERWIIYLNGGKGRSGANHARRLAANMALALAWSKRRSKKNTKT